MQRSELPSSDRQAGRQEVLDCFKNIDKDVEKNNGVVQENSQSV
jgi:hypothetical protein